MKPVVLIHGYSSEGSKSDAASVHSIYGDLPERLAGLIGPDNVIPVNLSRYISLDDGIGIDDVSMAMDRAIKRDFPHHLNGFNAIVHSTGALVARNWIRRHSPKPSPLERIIYLAGANHGSGWAHVGESLMAKWLRLIAQHSQRGLAVLNALELGSSWTIDLHEHFLHEENDMQAAYNTLEFNLIGSQVPAEWTLIPIRYGKEDGSDGVIRTSATSLNHAYIRLKPTDKAKQIDWAEASAYAKQIGKRKSMQSKSVTDDELYQIAESSIPGKSYYAAGASSNIIREEVPFALVYECAHSNSKTGIVYGSETRDSVMSLIKIALETTLDPTSYSAATSVYNQTTSDTYQRVAGPDHSARFLKNIKRFVVAAFFNNPYGQYDGHAQVVFRVKDQNGKPVEDFSIYFNSMGGDGRPSKDIDSLFEDKHKNNATPNCINFYLRLTEWDASQNGWVDRLRAVNGVDLEIDGVDPATGRALYLPLRMRIDQALLAEWVQPHRTTIIDVELMRIASNDTFAIY